VDDPLAVLRDSVERLRAIVEPLGPAELETQAYPADWTVADVLSHLGSGAVISQRWIDDAVEGRPVASGFEQAVWDQWAAKSNEVKASDAVAEDGRLLERLDALDGAERARFRFVLGPLDTDLVGFIGLRVNEHALHTWDIDVAFDHGATVPSDAAGAIVDRLELITRFTGRPTGTAHRVRVHTSDPGRDLTVVYGVDSVALEYGAAGAAADIELPTEAFVRLVYGRLDPAHAPATGAPAVLEELRATFPGP